MQGLSGRPWVVIRVLPMVGLFLISRTYLLAGRRPNYERRRLRAVS